MIPDDDPSRSLTVADPDDPGTTYVSLVGTTYAMPVTGEQTLEVVPVRACRSGSTGPRILEGEIQFAFRGEKYTVGAGATVTVPANAPHNFRNVSGAPARMLRMCTPAGQDEYFLRIGDVVAGKDAPPPQLSEGEVMERRRRAAEPASTYRSEFLQPTGTASRHGLPPRVRRDRSPRPVQEPLRSRVRPC
ncbi:cupin domain-containing protein [Streptomyces sp. NPDC058307]|uniref:cupin domain-containing protein n=1 Tax=Streptomyces sp. NPDC058307 TaxID=3346439 RepID=UPI0036EE356B